MSSDQSIKPYSACCVQAYWEHAVEGDALKKRNLQMMCDYIDAAFVQAMPTTPTRLICFPEFSIGGVYEITTTIEEVKNLQAITIPGPETEILAEKAKQHNCYIVACNPENDPAVPNYFFNTAFIINPKGKIILKYHKLNVRFGLNPHDMLAQYKNPITGEPDPFPVVDTEIGRLGCYICGDINIPEIPRVYSLKGADVVIRCDGGYGSWDLAIWTLRVRARDNKIYIVNENWAATVIKTAEAAGGERIPLRVDTSHGGGSCVIDYEGNIVRQAHRIGDARGHAPQLVSAPINVTARRQHADAAMDGPGGIKTELFVDYYSKPIFPPNQFINDGPPQSRSDPRKAVWDQQGKDNWHKLAHYYSENDVK